MTRLITPICLSLAVAACGSRIENIPYSFGALERPYEHLPNLAEQNYVPNASKVLPPVLIACGIKEFQEFRSDQGEYALAFELPANKESEVSRCIEGRAPKGANLHRVYTL